MEVIVVGGGWAGCSAAFFAKKAGADVTLIEKTDMLLGTGLVGGIFRNNGRFTAAEEIIALGGANFFEILDKQVRHTNIDFPGHKHASIYDVTKIEPAVRKLLDEQGVKIKLKTRIQDVIVNENNLVGLIDQQGERLIGDVFIDTTGSAGPMKNCLKYGSGCVMCILRCPSFGPRTSIIEKLGIPEIEVMAGFDMEAMSGSCKLDKSSISPDLINELNQEGVIILPLPKEFYKPEALGKKACQQYALKEFAENIIILDTGHAKLMTSHIPLESLRAITGFENARYADPYSGGQGNSIRFTTLTSVDFTMQIKGVENLFAAGERAGLFVGHTEAVVTGMLAGHNAVRHGLGQALLTLPPELAVGDFIQFSLQEMQKPEGRNSKYTFSGAVYFKRMQDLGLYMIDKDKIHQKVATLGLSRLFEVSLGK